MTDQSATLWKAWSEGRLAVQRCESCGRSQHPPAQVCGSCHARQLSITDVEGLGQLVTWSTVHRAPSADFAADIPYTVCVVELPSGALIEARLVGTGEDSPRIGAQVRLHVAPVAGRSVPIAEVVQ